MRQNLIVALLSVCVTLLAVQLVVSLQAPPAVVGQESGGSAGNGYVLATSSISQNEPVVFILDTNGESPKLLTYSVKNKGIEFKGVRDLKYDKEPREYPVGGRYTVEFMEKLTKKKK